MKISLLLFGITKDIVGGNRLELDVNDKLTVEQLKKQLRTLYPKFGELKSFAIAINSTYVKDDIELHSGDEIAIIPPVSGG